MTSPARVLVGKCECGAVRYRVAEEFRYTANCHCSRCRAATGSAFKALDGIEREDLNDTAVERAARCSSKAWRTCLRPRRIGGRSGASRASARREHIFVGSKAAWFEITNELAQNEEY